MSAITNPVAAPASGRKRTSQHVSWGLLAFFALLGLSLLGIWVILSGGTALVGMNDFLCFYSAGSFTGSSEFYNIDHMQQRQLARTGMMGDNLVFVRLPYLALLFAPFSHLPYQTAYRLWQALSLGALLLMLRLWPVPSPRVAGLFACLSFPIMLVFVTGQDVLFLLLWIALAAWLLRRNRAGLAGGVLALCVAKFHFFVFLPLLLWRHRSRALLLGLLAVGSVLLGLCFVAGGPDWIAAYWTALADPRPHAGAEHMPNLHGLISVWHWPAFLEWPFAALVAAGAWSAVRRGDYLWQMSAILCAGLLISYHAYVYDCALLLPAALTVMTHTQYRLVRFASVALLTPAPYLASMHGYPAVPLLVGFVLAGMALQRRPVVTSVSPLPASSS